MYSFADEKLTYESELVVKESVELISITPKESSVVRKIAPESEVKAKVVQSTVKQLIDKHFDGEDAKVAYAIIKAESSANPRAVGYNCFYTADGTVHETRVAGAKSTHCKKGHEQYSHSVDCGLAQISFKGKACPQKAFDPEWNLAEMKRYHDDRGWKPWVAYTTKRHLAYME